MAIEEILSKNEEPAYGDELVSIEMDNREVFVISDLHIAAGGPAPLLQSLQERRVACLRFRIVCGE